MCAEPVPARRRALRQQQRGLSLIEIMVGMIVALLVSLAASGGAAVFTAAQRQGVGAGGTAVNAGTALAAIKNEAASAGLGFFGDSSFRCFRLDLSVGAAVKLDAASFAPVRITSGVASDRIDVLFATNVDSGANVLLKGPSTGASATLMSLMPVVEGQAVLLAPATAGGTCRVRSVTAMAASTIDTPQVLTFGSAGTYNAGAFTNAVAYAEKDTVALLGGLQWSRYSVTGGNLVLERPLSDDSAVLVRNVMTFRAQYGIATSATAPTLAGWQNAVDDSAGATGVNWTSVAGANVERVRALRLGIVTRSPQREKPDAAGNCVASEAKPVLFGTVVDPDVGADWGCYRYRTSVVVVPLRNVAW
jgi:type IV pilus assembly protein PilW